MGAIVSFDFFEINQLNIKLKFNLNVLTTPKGTPLAENTSIAVFAVGDDKKNIAKVAVKRHRMSNLILNCYLSRDITTRYVRPRLE